MPLRQCEGDGWKWGDAGKCYHGPDAKRDAIAQGLAAGGGHLDTEKAGELHSLYKARLKRLLRRVRVLTL